MAGKSVGSPSVTSSIMDVMVEMIPSASVVAVTIAVSMSVVVVGRPWSSVVVMVVGSSTVVSGKSVGRPLPSVAEVEVVVKPSGPKDCQ